MGGDTIHVSQKGFDNLRNTVPGVPAKALAKLVAADECIDASIKPRGGPPTRQSEALTSIVAVYAAGSQNNPTIMASAQNRFYAAFPACQRAKRCYCRRSSMIVSTEAVIAYRGIDGLIK